MVPPILLESLVPGPLLPLYIPLATEDARCVLCEAELSLLLSLLTSSLLSDNGCEWVNEIKNNLLLL